MSLKDIIVCLDKGPGCTARFMAAIDLARRHRACLKGLYVISHPFYTPQSDMESDFFEVKTFFMNAASKSGVMAEWLYVNWNVVGVPMSEVIALHAFSTDMVIIGGTGTGRKALRGSHELPERVILAAGRPVVVFPASGNTFEFGKNIFVAWKGGRESARAVHDALPLLEKASRVSIVAVVSGEEEKERESVGLSSLGEFLARHDIHADINIVMRGNRPVSKILVERINQEQADLLVMGGFTYGLWGAPVFGELAREMMLRMPLPMLFSH